MDPYVILVNNYDEVIGVMEKMEAHRSGALHRAFSIFIFNSRGEMLVQQRAMTKYHSAGLWSNACCSHPRPGEETLPAATKRLKEEMGFETKLEKLFDLVYEASFDNGLKEHEFDHVLIGEYDGPVLFNKEEVMDHAFRNMKELKRSIEASPGSYTEWFKLIFPKMENWWKEKYPQTTLKAV